MARDAQLIHGGVPASSVLPTALRNQKSAQPPVPRVAPGWGFRLETVTINMTGTYTVKRVSGRLRIIHLDSLLSSLFLNYRQLNVSMYLELTNYNITQRIFTTSRRSQTTSFFFS